MRTLKLTHEQIDLICQALGIAETQFTNIHKTIVETTVNVRKHHASKREQNSKALYYHDMASKLADLNIDINNSKFDV
jgi:hypothetical protein